MKINEMQKVKEMHSDAIGFLHMSEHSFLQELGIETKCKSFYSVIDQIIAFYKMKHLTNKQASKLIAICCNANPLKKGI